MENTELFFVHGADALARFAGVPSLAPEIHAVKSLITAVSSANAKLDEEAETAFHSLVKEYVSASPSGLQDIGETLLNLQGMANENVAKSIERKIRFVMTLPFDASQKAELTKIVVKGEYESGRIDKETIKSLAKIFAVTAAGAILIAVAGSAYKKGRAPTFMESILGKK